MVSTRTIAATAVAMLVAGALQCGGHKLATTTSPPAAPPPKLAPTAVTHQRTLRFPAPKATRRSRPARPELRRWRSGRAAVISPELASDEVLTIDAKTLRIHFDRPMQGARAGAAAAAHVQITPAVVGQIRWQDAATLAFVADHYFDPSERHQLKLVGLKGANGAPLQDWQCTFRSRSGGIVAGKTLSHKPVAGKPRMVASSPSDGGTIGPRGSVRVLFDQPVTLGQASAQIMLRKNDTPVALRLGWAPVGRFAGVAVDRRQVVVLAPTAPLAKGGAYVLDVADAAGPENIHHIELPVAEPLTLEEGACGGSPRGDEQCARSADGVLHTSKRSIHFVFNNPLRIKKQLLRAHVQVDPFVRNLRVQDEGDWYQGRLVFAGDFQPSTTYRITIAGLRDRFGGRQREVLRQRVEMLPLGASVSMPEGFVALDKAHTLSFTIDSRNAKSAVLRLWRVDDNNLDDFRRAMEFIDKRQRGELSTAAPQVVNITISPKRDALVHTRVDLSDKLKPNASYLAELRLKEAAFGAIPTSHHASAAAAKPALALLRGGGDSSLSAMVHSGPNNTLIYVTRRRDGQPVAGAQIRLLPGNTVATSDDQGVAVLAVDSRKANHQLLRVSAGGQQLVMPLDARMVSAEQLFPALDGAEVGGAQRALVMTDRGIYRPGATIRLKGSLFTSQRGRLKPVTATTLRLVVLDAQDDKVCDTAVTSTALGGVAADCTLTARARMGLYRAELRDATSAQLLAKRQLRVAAFVPPRFKLEVSANASTNTAGAMVLRGKVAGRYLFGAPMDGAAVAWSVQRQPAPFPRGPHSAAGLVFARESSWRDDEQADEGNWSRTGRGTLDASGTLALVEPLELGTAHTPMRFTLAADVHDDTHQHVAGRQQLVVHPAPRYAGVKVDRRWVDAGEVLHIKLGVMDTAGKPVVGANVVARLQAVEWKYEAQRGAGGALHHHWRQSQREVARCAVSSATRASDCELKVPAGGDYLVVSEVDGRQGGTRSVWAYAGAGQPAASRPNKGHVVQLVADKGHYRPGDVAKVLVRNPYPAATAILTVDMGGVLSHRAQRVTDSEALFEVPIEARYAPHVHAMVTLLPIGAAGAQASSYRVGALRLAVARVGQRLQLALASDRNDYRPGEQVEVTVKVTDRGKAEVDAEVALAVVDEGVLRLTNHHAPDPLSALRPPLPLSFVLRHSRAAMADLFERSHVAGDGGGGAASGPPTRHNFVKTALWRPLLRTDANGEAKVRFKLPDDLTEFRMMAVALNREGKGAVKETSFTVSKPVLIQPALPRFAVVGDDIELSAWVHNDRATPFVGKLNFAGTVVAARVPARGRTRVATHFRPQKAVLHTLTMELTDGAGEVMDRVSRRLPVKWPTLPVHPQLDGVFRGEQQIRLTLPASITFNEGEALTVKVGANLWPELGGRLEYLLNYPHGCVEQTTSSTLPLLAAREMMPRIGLDAHDEAFYRVRVEAGLKRLASMRTSGGGLAYWPGGRQANAYGSAYAMRALVRAKEAGIEAPKGLLEGLTQYLLEQVANDQVAPMVRVSMAQSLAELKLLPPSRADALYDLRGKLGLFGKATLALALADLTGQRDRIDTLLNDVEAGFDDDGALLQPDSYRWYGSEQRSRAQAVMALVRSRPGASRLPRLVQRLAHQRLGYTTQANAYSLLALAAHLVAQDSSVAELAVTLDGARLVSTHKTDAFTVFRIPLQRLAGHAATLTLTSRGKQPVGFFLQARYGLPYGGADGSAAEASAAFLAAQSSAEGPDVYRVVTTPEGDAVDLQHVELGQLLRVAVYATIHASDDQRSKEYLAITDPLPAGFEPVNTALATTAADVGPGERHPFAAMLRQQRRRLSYLEQHDDRVKLYFDRIDARHAAASYLVRATSRGSFVLPPTEAELMYLPDSTSYGSPGRVVIR